MLLVVQTALELGFHYAPVALALFLSFRVLDIADLTTDGCFVLGAAVSVTLTAAGHPLLAVPAAMLAGACAGFITAFLQTRLSVPSILAGIVTNTGLYTINLMAMGWRSNESLLGSDTVFTLLRSTGLGGDWYELVLAAAVTLLCAGLLALFLGTRLGLSIRATGDNPDMVRASSLDPTFTVTVGLCLSMRNVQLLSRASPWWDSIRKPWISAPAPASWSSDWRVSSSARPCWAAARCIRVFWRRWWAPWSTALSTAWCFTPRWCRWSAWALRQISLCQLAIAAPGLRRWAAFQKQKHSRKEAA